MRSSELFSCVTANEACHLSIFATVAAYAAVTALVDVTAGVNKKHEKFIFEYRVFSQKLYLNMWCFEKVHICIPNMR